MENLIEISLTFLLALFILYYYLRDKKGFPTNWPLVGMLPALLLNFNRFHDYVVELMPQAHQMSFLFKGPWFTSMVVLVTGNPSNVHHVMSQNFGNYPKGRKFNEICEILGDGMFNADSPFWEFHRKLAQSFLGHPKFHQFLVNKIVEKLESGLIPVLDHVCKQGVELDLQDLFGRFGFDTISIIIMDFDPKTLSIGLPTSNPDVAKALDEVEEVILYRHALPTFLWKFQRWLNIGLEKKYKEAWKILDDFAYNCIDIKRSHLLETSKNLPTVKINETTAGADFLTLYMEENARNASVGDKIKDDKFLRDTALNFIIAGTSTTNVALAWFFYLLSKNQRVESKIRAELEEMMHNDDPIEDLSKNSRELLSKLIYLHAALCEALRLYPPVAFQAKNPAKPDVLPSGHKVTPDTQIIISMYAMARMKSIWGDDCCEFKPERWITEQGKIKHEPSYKFLAFNAGPRSCVGKDMAFTQMKIVAATVIRKYRFEAVEGFPVVPNISIVLHMKHGFKVKVVRLELL